MSECWQLSPCQTPSSSGTSSGHHLFNPCGPCCSCVANDLIFRVFHPVTTGCSPQQKNFYCEDGWQNFICNSGVVPCTGITLGIPFYGVAVNLYNISGILINSVNTDCSGIAKFTRSTCQSGYFSINCPCYYPCSGTLPANISSPKYNVVLQPNGSENSNFILGSETNGSWTTLTPFCAIFTITSGCDCSPITPPGPGDPDPDYCHLPPEGYSYKEFCIYCPSILTATVNVNAPWGCPPQDPIAIINIDRNGGCESGPVIPDTFTDNFPLPTGACPPSPGTQCSPGSFSQSVSYFLTPGQYTITNTIGELLYSLLLKGQAAGMTIGFCYSIDGATPDYVKCPACTGCFNYPNVSGNLYATDPAGSFNMYQTSQTSWSGCHLITITNAATGCMVCDYTSGTVGLLYNLNCYAGLSGNFGILTMQYNNICSGDLRPVTGVCNGIHPTLRNEFYKIFSFNEITCNPLSVDIDVYGSGVNFIFPDSNRCYFPFMATE